MLLHERYRLLTQVGTGGFGAVYRAEDTLQDGEIVAVKQINLQGLSAQQKIEATDGFYREVRLLSGLKHPNLPAIHDSFTDPEHWYIVMDFIEGETLETYLKQRFSGQQPGLPLNEMIALGLQLCTVLDYLHTREPPIIFRDLKPANIMRTSTGQLYLIDFGIARHFIPGKPKDTIPFGSPGYAPPEQYGRAQTTPQADLYSLGALLHHLLTGDDPAESPFRFAPLRLYGPPALEELDRLIQRLVQIDAGERPASAAEVKEALQRLADAQAQAEPRLWQPPAEPLPLPPPYTTYTGWHTGSAGQQQQQVAKPRGVLNRRRLISTGLKIGGTVLVGYGIVQVCVLAESLFPRRYFTGVVAVPFTPAPTPIPNFIFSQHKAAVTTIAWSPSGQFIASGSADKTVLVWRSRDGALVYTFTGYQSPVTSVTWSSDEMCVASSGADDGTVQVWDSTDSKDIHSYPEQSGKVLALSWSSIINSLMASGGEDKTVRLWNANDGHHITTLHGHTGSVRAVAWSPYGSLKLASASADTTVRIWESFFPQEGIVGQKNIICRGHSAAVNALSWSSDGKMIASASDDGTVQVWNTADGSHVFTYRGHKGPVNAVVWHTNADAPSSDTPFLVSGGDDKTVQVWNLAGERLAIYTKHTAAIRSLASQYNRIASASDDHTVHIWTVTLT